MTMSKHNFWLNSSFPVVRTVSAVAMSDSLMHQYGISSMCGKKVTEQHVLDISQKTCKKWKDLRVFLKMSENSVSDIEREAGGESDKRKSFFDRWKQEKGSDATYKALLDALLKIECREDAEYICELLQDEGSTNILPDNSGCATPSLLRVEDTDGVGPFPLEVQDRDPGLPVEKERMKIIRPDTKSIPQRDSINIVFAGKGKSTLFKRLFNEEMEKGRLTSYSLKGKIMHVARISSYKDGDQELDKFKNRNGQADLLVYCMPVYPGARFHEQNPKLMRHLHTVFGRADIWKHCVVVATFSNQAWGLVHQCNNRNPDDQYTQYLRSYSTDFGYELCSISKVHELWPKTIFDYAVGASCNRADEKTIPVIPAGYASKDIVIPGVQKWADKVFNEMLNKCDDACKEALEGYQFLSYE